MPAPQQMVSTPHDSLFRDTFGRPEHAAPLLRALIAPPLVAAIDWDDAAVRAIVEWADVARRLLTAPTGQAAIEALSSYFLKVTKLGRRRLAIVFDQHIGAASMTKFESTYDRITSESRAEGKVEGKAEGERAGAATLLLQLLNRRFGKVPKVLTMRVAKGTRSDIDRWADRVLDAASLTDVFSD